MEHNPSRQVSDEEVRLWEEVRAALDRSQFERVSVIQVGSQSVGLHEERSRQIARTWDNEGLVVAFGAGANEVSLTEYGRQVDSIAQD